MSTSDKRIGRGWRLGLVLAGCWLAAPLALAEDLDVQATLIWGTNDEKSDKPNHKPVDKATAEEFRKVFKWKNYFSETVQKEKIPSRQSKTLKMSEDCSVEITELPGEPIEVKLFGKGKPINKITAPLRPKQLFIIGGPDKNQCAWFVVIEKK